MSRTEKLLLHVDKNGLGIEIGPSYSPVAPKRDGFNVHIIDHLSREQLLEKYRDQKVELANIEEVDFVWHGEPYTELTGKQKAYDWIIASHVIEHAPDLIGFLNACDSLLHENGVLSLAIPDVRYCFDHFRPMSGLGKVIDAHHFGHKVHTPGTAAEATLNYVARGGCTAWSSETTTGEYKFLDTLSGTRAALDGAVQDPVYHDYHAWCFTPSSFRLLIHDLHSLGYIPFQEVSFFPSYGCEFHMTLGRSGSGSGLARLELLEQVQAETAAERQNKTQDAAPDTVRDILQVLRDSGTIARRLLRSGIQSGLRRLRR